MSSRQLFVLLFCVVTFGCSTATQPKPETSPKTVQIQGTVRYRSGAAVFGARVMTLAGVRDTSFTDSLGQYSLELPVAPDSVKILAESGYGPYVARAGSYVGAAWIRPDRDQTLDITLTVWGNW